MKFVKRNRSATKLLMKCFQCHQDTQPKDGDWHDGEHNQVFLCRSCESGALRSARKPLLARTPARSAL